MMAGCWVHRWDMNPALPDDGALGRGLVGGMLWDATSRRFRVHWDKKELPNPERFWKKIILETLIISKKLTNFPDI
jgi:hypothetical protein